MNDFVKAIFDEAEKQGYSPQDVAEYSGVSYPTIHKIMIGETRCPNMRTVIRLAEAVGLAVAAKRPWEDTYTSCLTNAIRAAVWSRDKTIEQISLDAGMDSSTIYDMMGDGIRHNVETWEKLAGALGIEMALVRREDIQGER